MLTLDEQAAVAALEQSHRAFRRHTATGKSVEEAAAVVHQLAVDANACGRMGAAADLLGCLLPLTDDVYAADPQSLHAIWNDLGAMRLEAGRRVEAFEALKRALEVLTAAAGSNSLAQDPALILGTLATLLSTSIDLGWANKAATYVEQGKLLLPLAPGDERALKFEIAVAIWRLAMGEVGAAEAELQRLGRTAAATPEFAVQIARAWGSLAASLTRRRQYRRALDAFATGLDIAGEGPFRHDVADLISGQAAVFYILASENVRSPAWREARRKLDEAARVREQAPRVLASSGCDELHLRSIMALEEGRVGQAQRDNAAARSLALTVFDDSDSIIGDIELARAGIALTLRRPVQALSIAEAVLEARTDGSPQHRPHRMRALGMCAEAQRRLGRRQDAADYLERALDVEEEMVRHAISPAWRPAEAALSRRSHDHLNAFVDALLPDARTLDVQRRIFSRVAASKDLALRTLREVKGGTASNLRSSTLVEDVAAALPQDAAYLEFFVHHPRRVRRLRAGWTKPKVLAFVVTGQTAKLAMVNLGTYAPMRRLVRQATLAREAERPAILHSLSRRITTRLNPLLNGCRTVFIAPDGQLHGAAFSALASPDGPWLKHRQVALVESAAGVVSASADRAAALTRSLILTAPDAGPGTAYAPLPYAMREGDILSELLGAKHLRVPSWPPPGQGLFAYLIKTQRPQILHVAAHADTFHAAAPPRSGWRPERWKAVTDAIDDYDRSRLILSGFNAWAAGELPQAALDQVSITANTLASYPLQGVELLTLSVCHGGQGLEQTLESAASLATAARIGGAGAVVAALWPVPDAATQELMQHFHQAFRQGRSAIDALHRAQTNLRDRGGPLSAWGSFVVWAGPDDLRALRPNPPQSPL